MNDEEKSKAYDRPRYRKAYNAWMKALWIDRDLLDETIRNSRKPYGIDVRAVAQVIATYGTNGYWCIPKVGTVAMRFNCDPDTIERWRLDIVKRGWFTVMSRNGGTNNRSLVLGISIPGETACREKTECVR